MRRLWIKCLRAKIKNPVSLLFMSVVVIAAQTASCSSRPLTSSPSSDEIVAQKVEAQTSEKVPFLNSERSDRNRSETKLRSDNKSKINVPLAGSGGINALEHRKKPVVVMISIDGFRADYLTQFKPPHLRAIASTGIRSVGMESSFPSSTFPNHITLVSGRFPGHHGIVGNSFYDERRSETYSMRNAENVADGSWYLTDTTWTVAERHGMVSAAYFWVGSEAKIAGLSPTYSLPYDMSIPNDVRVSKVLEWLSMSEEKRPHLIHLYFSDVDSMGHKFGTDSAEVRKAVLDIDHQIGRLFGAAARSDLPVNFVIVSDHGMQNLDEERVIDVGTITDLADLNPQERGAYMMLYSNDETKIEAAFSDLKKSEKNFKVYRRSEVPKKFAFNHPDRVGDLVVIADIPYYLIDRVTPDRNPLSNMAAHGWDPSHKAMHALFIAQGPQIASGQVVPVFQNIHVYPFVMSILGLPTGAEQGAPPIDGLLSVLKPYRADRRLAGTDDSETPIHDDND